MFLALTIRCPVEEHANFRGNKWVDCSGSGSGMVVELRSGEESGGGWG